MDSERMTEAERRMLRLTANHIKTVSLILEEASNQLHRVEAEINKEYFVGFSPSALQVAHAALIAAAEAIESTENADTGISTGFRKSAGVVNSLLNVPTIARKSYGEA